MDDGKLSTLVLLGRKLPMLLLKLLVVLPIVLALVVDFAEEVVEGFCFKLLL